MCLQINFFYINKYKANFLTKCVHIYLRQGMYADPDQPNLVNADPDPGKLKSTKHLLISKRLKYFYF